MHLFKIIGEIRGQFSNLHYTKSCGIPINGILREYRIIFSEPTNGFFYLMAIGNDTAEYIGVPIIRHIEVLLLSVSYGESHLPGFLLSERPLSSVELLQFLYITRTEQTSL